MPDDRASAGRAPVLARRLAGSVRVRRRAAPWKGAIAVAASLVLMAGMYLFFRPGYVTVITAPPAEVAIDGEPLGTSPVRDHGLSAGTHRITARSDGFVDLDLTVSIERGSTYVHDPALKPLDPADGVALRRLAEALGVERAEIRADPLRPPAAEPAGVVLWPRGGRREAPREVVLWAKAPVQDVRILIEELGQDGADRPTYDARIATLFQRTVSTLPEEVRARIEAGRIYRVRLMGPEGRDVNVARFWVLSSATAARIDEEVAQQLVRVDPADPARMVLRADLLLSRGLIEEPLNLATEMLQRLGERREIARIALASLEHAGLRDIGPWAGWAEVLARAKD